MTNELSAIIVDERKKREIDPTLAVLRECVAEIDDKESRKRIKDILTFFEEMPLYEDVRKLSRRRPPPRPQSARPVERPLRQSKNLSPPLWLIYEKTADCSTHTGITLTSANNK